MKNKLFAAAIVSGLLAGSAAFAAESTANDKPAVEKKCDKDSEHCKEAMKKDKNSCKTNELKKKDKNSCNGSNGCNGKAGSTSPAKSEKDAKKDGAN